MFLVTRTPAAAGPDFILTQQCFIFTVFRCFQGRLVASVDTHLHKVPECNLHDASLPQCITANYVDNKREA